MTHAETDFYHRTIKENKDLLSKLDAAETALAASQAKVGELQKDGASRAQINLAVNRSCGCGGREPGTPSTCPACEVWHRLFGDLVPPKPVPIAATSARAAVAALSR